MYKDYYKFADKKVSGKVKEELGEKKHDIDKRLDVSGQLSTKKGKKGNLITQICMFICIYSIFSRYINIQLFHVLQMLKLQKLAVRLGYLHLVQVVQIQIQVLPAILHRLVIQVILNMVSDIN